MRNSILLLIFNYLLPYTKSGIPYMRFPELNRNINSTETKLHLNYTKILKACNDREGICRSNDTNVCTVRRMGSKMEYRNFENACLLFMSNMCEYPGEEFNIASSGVTCDELLKSRRHDIVRSSNNTESKNNSNNVQNITKAKPILRGTTVTTISTIYDIDTAYDFHMCPLSCPKSYSPVCVCVNRGFGLHFKFYTFINHCEADRYYCKNWEEFSPPPDEEEKVQSSKLGWSYCGASRYLQFARFSEVASSLGHYGWLEGDYKYSHIMEPYERKPGYGK